MKLDHAAMLIAIQERDCGACARILVAHFGLPECLADCEHEVSAIRYSRQDYLSPQDASYAYLYPDAGHTFTWSSKTGFFAMPSGVRAYEKGMAGPKVRDKTKLVLYVHDGDA